MHLLDASAWCTECDWTTEGRNAMGVAAIHHQKKGHCTMVELAFSQVFGNPSSNSKPLSPPPLTIPPSRRE